MTRLPLWSLLLIPAAGWLALCWYRPVWAVVALAVSVVLVGVWVLRRAS